MRLYQDDGCERKVTSNKHSNNTINHRNRKMEFRKLFVKTGKQRNNYAETFCKFALKLQARKINGCVSRKRRKIQILNQFVRRTSLRLVHVCLMVYQSPASDCIQDMNWVTAALVNYMYQLCYLSKKKEKKKKKKTRKENLEFWRWRCRKLCFQKCL